jgi:mono/diheme cytochrome c family protein
MKRLVYLCLALTAMVAAPSREMEGRRSPTMAPQSASASQQALLTTYCITCHNDRLKTGGFSLDKLDIQRVAENAETWEKVVRKLRAGMMPPSGSRRPDRATIDAFAASIETALDRAADSKPNSGTRALARLNRTEYDNAVRDLIDLEIDTSLLFPGDDSSDGFDNIADTLRVSPALLERYMAAAAKISRMAVGNPSIGPTSATYRVRSDLSQNDHIEGLPLGTRGGILIEHNFPLDAQYAFKVGLLRTAVGAIFGGAAPGEQLELSIDGARVHLINLGGTGREDPAEIRRPVKAGPHRIGVAFLRKSAAVTDDVWQPSLRSTTDIETGQQVGYTTLPHLTSVAIAGPFEASGSGDTPSRRKIFVCQPATSGEELPCARKIVSTLARRAYRRPVEAADIDPLLAVYQSERKDGSFDNGIEAVLNRVLADPEFIFRFERDPSDAKAGVPYRISNIELASRLSFFLWSSIPDDELLDLASSGKLKDPAVLEAQVKRMLADPRSMSLASNFGGQWLFLRELKHANSVAPDFDDNLRQAFRRETELFFESIIREDRSVMEFLKADYTFVDERLARHYGIPNVYGSRFRRVTLQDGARRGLLGQGSILLVTSVPNRTSPVSRGRWVLENILGTPAPLPPPDVPGLKESDGRSGDETSVRERMEEHRKNPACDACHRIMDPIGFALENFDLAGKWRTHDGPRPIDASSVLVDGTKLDGPASLRDALLTYREQFVRTLTSKLMTYGVGRGVQYYDMPAVRAITRQAATEDYRFSSLVLGVVKSAPFQMRIKTELRSQE